jgi:uncharacterized membrane protein YdjX (TVP38/TMEM64 family)
MENPTEAQNTPLKPKKKGVSQSVSIIIFSVLIMVLAGIVFTQDMNYIREFISKAGAWGVLVSILLYALLGLTLIPSEPLTLFIGAIFGPWLALLIAGTGNTLAALVEYYLGTHIGTATNFVEQKKKLPFGLGKLQVDSPMFLIGARMIPGYGPKVVSMMAGIYHVPVLTYLWTTAVPIFVGAALFAFGGKGIALLANIK